MTLDEIREEVLNWSKGIVFNRHTYDKILEVGGVKFKIRPDDTFYLDDQVIIVEYERTRRPVESITKYFWLLKNTEWLSLGIPIKLLFVIASPELKASNIRLETIVLLGDMLKEEYPQEFSFSFLYYPELSEQRIQTELKAFN